MHPLSAHTYRPLPLVALIATALCIAWIVGILTNLAGTLVYPHYYAMVLGWDLYYGSLSDIIAQGLFEATFAGLATGLVYACVVAWFSRASCPYKPAALHLLRWLTILPITWLFGGTVALLLRFLSPYQLINVMAVDVPAVAGLSPAQFTRYAWVGGTIEGTYAGAVIAILLASITFPARWRRIRLRLHMARTGHTPFCLNCGYNQRRTTGTVCPECGATVRNPPIAAASIREELNINTSEIH
ncbi:MAG: hypothetical protein ACTHN5_07060 [Phycisphaerae bacterium]